jgi:hypothetical protein
MVARSVWSRVAGYVLFVWRGRCGCRVGFSPPFPAELPEVVRVAMCTKCFGSSVNVSSQENSPIRAARDRTGGFGPIDRGNSSLRTPASRKAPGRKCNRDRPESDHPNQSPRHRIGRSDVRIGCTAQSPVHTIRKRSNLRLDAVFEDSQATVREKWEDRTERRPANWLHHHQ